MRGNTNKYDQVAILYAVPCNDWSAKRKNMDKEGFRKALVDAGYSCLLKNGIPTVQTSDKKAISAVRKLAKELSYNESFGIAFNGTASLDDLTEDSEPLVEETEPAEPAEEVSEEVSEKMPETKDDEPVVEESSSSELLSQPSIFDAFDDFD